MIVNEPWSKPHKCDFRGCPFSLSNSFAQPLSQKELVTLARARGDQEIIDAYNNHELDYTPNGGSADLREEIAKLYGENITKDHVLVFAGAQVALQTAAFAFAGRGCHSIVFTPGYQSTIEAPLQAGGQVTKIKLKPENEWQIDPKEVESAMQENTRYMVLNQPYNPAGTLISKEVLAELKDIAERNDVVILCDEVYRLLEHQADDRLPAMADFYKNGISCVTISKPWGGCGITIGWLTFQNKELRQKLLDVQYFGTACPSRASEIQGIMTLRASDEILKRNIKIIRHNLGLLEKFMERYSDLFEWVRPTAGAICFIKFKGPLSSKELGDMMMKKGLSMKPSYCFSNEISPDIDYFRVGYGEEIMPKALDVLIAFVEEHKEAWRAKMMSGAK